METTSTGSSRQRSSVATIDLDALDCTICYNPLQPPVFQQCGVGHVICSSCHGKLLDTSRCHMCSRDGGYRRCVAVDHILYAITVPCPNAAHGCAARTPYHDSHGHAAGCPHAPCFCPEPGCGFAAGATAALLAHFTGTHGWPATVMWRRRAAVGVPLQEGKRVLSLLDDDGRGSHLFLLNVAQAGEAGLVGTVLAVEAAAAAAAHGHGDAPRFECKVSFDRRGTGWRQSSTFGVRSTNLSGGLPADGFAFVAPNPPPAAASVTITLFDISSGEPGSALRPVLPRSRRSRTRLSATTTAAVAVFLR
uniref:RING-type E3 ubiquitin transferase n=1 Tax=Oryza glaberrima TaxID=4538 RepID=I1NJV7_ORYGL